MNIPILSYILRKIRKNRKPIEKTLKTGKPVEGEIKQRRFLGIIEVVSGKTFDTLKLGRKRKWLKRKKVIKEKL